jgi:outer membrane protein
MFKSLAILALLPLAGAVAQVPAVRSAPDSLHPISLDEAVALAQRSNPTAVQARGQLRTASSAVRSAWGSFIPTLNASMSQNKRSSERFDQTLDRFVTSQSPWNYQAGLSTSLELFDGGRRFAELRAARADVDAAEANDVSQRFSIALQVKREYANILAARESEGAARAQLEQAEAQLRAAVARVQAGAATMSDSLRSLIQVGNARLALMTAQNNIRVASATLTRLVGTPFTVTANPADTLERLVFDVDSGALEALARRGPVVLQAEMNLRAAGAGVAAARTSYLPTIDVSYNYSGSGTEPYRFTSGDEFRYGTSLRFSLNFPLFNNFSREDQMLRARVARDNSDAQLRDARLAAQQSFVQQFGALRTAEERIRIQQASVLAAEEDLRVMQQRYNLGASTLLDLLTSQSQLNQARADLIQARQDYRIARAQIEAIIGRDLN